jgi:uncharacterized protein with PhoU and TrkA domain
MVVIGDALAAARAIADAIGRVASRTGLSTAEESMADVAAKLADLVALDPSS